MDQIVKEQTIQQTRQYKYTKESYYKVKNKIAILSEDQRQWKLQQKESYTGAIVKVDPHYLNRMRLRVLYALYDIVRGKEKRGLQDIKQWGHMKNKTFSPYVVSQMGSFLKEYSNELTENIATIE